MIKRIVITDLTRMYHGNVCIAGYDKEHACVRPILPPPGLAEKTIVQDGKPIVFPFALVEFDFLDPVPCPPHTEDQHFIESSMKCIKKVEDRLQVLKWSIFPTVYELFGQPIHTDLGFYVMDCQGTRSVGTIQPKNIVNMIYAPGESGAYDYRLAFYDHSDTYYRLKITDLTWHYYCDHLRGKGQDPFEISEHLTNRLKSKGIYLRIGLSCGWKKYPDRCYLQINGIYTFPDILSGKLFADFYSRRPTQIGEIRESYTIPSYDDDETPY